MKDGLVEDMVEDFVINVSKSSATDDCDDIESEEDLD